MTSLSASEFPECEQFRKNSSQYGNCRHERLTPEKCDRWRIAHGLAPIDTTKAGVSGSFGFNQAEVERTPQPLPPEHKEQHKWTLAEKAISAAKVAADVAVNGFHPLSEQQIQERLSICQACTYFDKNRCKLCGCGLSDKVSLTNKLAHPLQKCPHDPPKWGMVQ